MRIGLISDTHDHIVHTRVAMAMFRGLGVESLLHAGDYCAPFMVPLMEGFQVHGVFGNNDGDHYRIQQRFAEIGGHLHAEFMDREFGGKRIAMYHGTQAGITEALIACGFYDLVVTGHTHTAENRLIGNTLHINPGSANGLGGTPTIAMYDTESGVGEIIGLGE